LVPPSMCTAVVKSITESYPGLLRRGVTQSPPGAPLGVPVGGTMVGTTPVGTGGAITGSTGTTAGISEIGGITGLAGTAALIQAAGQQGNGQGLQAPPIASPSIPGN